MTTNNFLNIQLSPGDDLDDGFLMTIQNPFFFFYALSKISVLVARFERI